MVNWFTKHALYFTVKDDTNAEQLVEIFLHCISKNHEVPDSIISDCGSLFTSPYWTNFYQALKIKNLLLTAYHPQTDSGMEWINQMLKNYLRIFTSYQQNDWVTLLSQAEFLYNNSLHSATRTTLFYLNYVYHPSPYSDPNPNHNLQTASMEEHLEKIKQAYIEIDEILQHAQAVDMKYCDKKPLEAQMPTLSIYQNCISEFI